jgi:hypothetical protein
MILKIEGEGGGAWYAQRKLGSITEPTRANENSEIKRRDAKMKIREEER